MQKDEFIRIRHMLDAARNAITFAEGKRRSDLDENPMLMFRADQSGGGHWRSCLKNLTKLATAFQ